MKDPWTDKVTLLLKRSMKLDKINQILIDDGLRKNVEIRTSVVFK